MGDPCPKCLEKGVRRVLEASASGYCSNHDPALAEKRRAAGAIRHRAPKAADAPDASELEADEQVPTIPGTLARIAGLDRLAARIVANVRTDAQVKVAALKLNAVGKRKDALRVLLTGLQTERKRQDDLRNLGEEAQRRAEEHARQEAEAAAKGAPQAPSTGNNVIAGMLSGSA